MKSLLASIAVTNEAIARGERGLSSERSQQALAAVREIAASGEDFTTDDVWELLDKPLEHNEASFMGSVMRHLSMTGEIVKTGEKRKSERPEQHRKPILVWRLKNDART